MVQKMKCPVCGSNKNLLTKKHDWVELECENCGTQWTKCDAGSKVIRIPIPRPKQRGWMRMSDQNEYLIYIRRKWKK